MQDGVSTHIFSAVRPLTSLLEACHAHDMARGQAPLPVNKKYLSVKNLQRGGRRRRGRWLQPNRRPGARLHLACVYVALASCASIGSARYTHCYVTLLSFLFCFRQLSVLTFPVAGGLRVHEFACACMFACGVSWLQCACLIMMAPGLRPPLPPDPTTENGGGGGGAHAPPSLRTVAKPKLRKRGNYAMTIEFEVLNREGGGAGHHTIKKTEWRDRGWPGSPLAVSQNSRSP